MAIIGSLADVVASDLADDFAAPSRIADTSWIQPGARRLVLVGGLVEPARGWRTSATTWTSPQRMGFEYVLVDAGWNAGWVPELVAYAAERGVRVLLWTDWRALATAGPARRGVRPVGGWGVAGVKADFLHSDSGERMAVIDDIAADAAARHLLVGFHGCTVPRGLQRTWPNVMTMEGVRGAEHGKSGRADDPAQNVTLAFTRNVIGSMDYTPVTFSAAGASRARPRSSRSRSSTSPGCSTTPTARAATARRGEALELLREVPAAWDDTRLLAGAPGALGDARPALRRALVRRVAERHRGDAGRRSTSASCPRARAYTARIYADAAGDGISGHRAARWTPSTRLTLALARHGGFAIVVTRRLTGYGCSPCDRVHG